MGHRTRSLWVTAIGIAVALPLAAACFSERAPSALQPDDAAMCQLPSDTAVDGSTIVVIRGYAFHPATVHVRRGGRVTWVNCEATAGLSHTSSSDSRSWASGLIEPGRAFTTTFGDAGSFIGAGSSWQRRAVGWLIPHAPLEIQRERAGLGYPLFRAGGRNRPGTP